MSQINDLNDRVQDKDMQMTTMMRKAEADMTKVVSELKKERAQGNEGAKLMDDEFESFKAEAVSEMSKLSSLKDGEIAELKTKHEALLDRQKNVIKSLEQEKKEFEDKLKEMEQKIKSASGASSSAEGDLKNLQGERAKRASLDED